MASKSADWVNIVSCFIGWDLFDGPQIVFVAMKVFSGLIAIVAWQRVCVTNVRWQVIS